MMLKCISDRHVIVTQGKEAAATRFRTEEQLMKLWKLLDSGADSRIQDEVMPRFHF